MIHVKMKWTGPRVKGLHKHLRYAYANVANWWHKHVLPVHFTKQGASKYHYEKRQGERLGGGRRRKGSYTGRKIAKHGHSLPLVYTGLARMLSRMRNIRATGKGARISIAVGNMLMNPKGRREREREMGAVAPGELQQMRRIFHKIVTDRLNTDRTTTVERVT